MANNQDVELRERIKILLDKSPISEEPPKGLWESIRCTWTGIWTDFHGKWDEKQASDVYPINDFLSPEREEKFTSDLIALIHEKQVEARRDQALRDQAYTNDENAHGRSMYFRSQIGSLNAHLSTPKEQDKQEK